LIRKTVIFVENGNLQNLQLVANKGLGGFGNCKNGRPLPPPSPEEREPGRNTRGEVK